MLVHLFARKHGYAVTRGIDARVSRRASLSSTGQLPILGTPPTLQIGG